MSKEQKRRKSTLKRPSDISASPTATASTSFVKTTRRISFSGQKSVKEFLPFNCGTTVWLSSYEESADERSPDVKKTKIPVPYANNHQLSTSNNAGMILRNSKVVVQQTTIQENRINITKPRRKKIQLPSVHDKENVMVLDNETTENQVIEMDISVENLDEIQEIKNDNHKRILEDKNINKNILSAKNCKIIDVELSPIPIIHQNSISDNLKNNSDSINHSDNELKLLSENYSMPGAQYSELTIYPNELSNFLRKSNSPDLYTSLLLDSDDFNKIKAFREGHTQIDFNNSTLRNFSFQQDKLSNNIPKESSSVNAENNENLMMNISQIDNNGGSVATYETHKKKRETIIISKDIEIDEIITKTKEYSKEKKIWMEEITNDENDMELGNYENSINQQQQQNEIQQSNTLQQQQQQQKQQQSKDVVEKRFVLHLNNGEIKEISLEEIEKADNKIIYSIKNDNERRTILINDGMDIDINNEIKNQFNLNSENAIEKRKTIILNQNMEETFSEMNNGDQNYDENKPKDLCTNKKRETILYTNDDKIDEESPTEMNKDKNKFEIITKNACNRKTIYLATDIELEEQPYFDQNYSFNAINENNKNSIKNRKTIHLSENIDETAINENYLFYESIQMNCNPENLNENSNNFPINTNNELEENNVENLKSQSKTKRHTIHLHEDIEIEEEPFNSNKSHLIKENNDISNRVLSNISRQTNCFSNHIDLDLSQSQNHKQKNITINSIHHSSQNINMENLSLINQENSNFDLKNPTLNHNLKDEYENKMKIMRRTVNMNEDIDLEQSSVNTNLSLHGNSKLNKIIPYLNNDIEIEESFSNNLFNDGNIHKNAFKTPVINVPLIENDKQTINLNESIKNELTCNNLQDHNCENSIKKSNESIHHGHEVFKIKPLITDKLNLNEDIDLTKCIGEKSFNSTIKNYDEKFNTSHRNIENSLTKSLLHRRKIIPLSDKKLFTQNERKAKKIDNVNSIILSTTKSFEQNYGNSSNILIVKPRRRETDYTIQDIDLEDELLNVEGPEHLKEPEHLSDEKRSIRKTLFPNDDVEVTDCNFLDKNHKIENNTLEKKQEKNQNILENIQSTIETEEIIHNFENKLNKTSEILPSSNNLQQEKSELKGTECILTTTITMEMDVDEIVTEDKSMKKESNRRTVFFPKQSELDLTCNLTKTLILDSVQKNNDKSCLDFEQTLTNTNADNNFEKSQFKPDCTKDQQIKNNKEILLQKEENLNLIKNNEISCHSMSLQSGKQIKKSSPLQIQKTPINGTSQIPLQANLENDHKSIPVLSSTSTVIADQFNIDSNQLPSQKRNRTTFLQSSCNKNEMILDSPTSYQPSKKEKNSTEKKKKHQSRLPISIARVNLNKKSPSTKICQNNDRTEKCRKTIVFSSKSNEMDIEDEISSLPNKSMKIDNNLKIARVNHMQIEHYNENKSEIPLEINLEMKKFDDVQNKNRNTMYSNDMNISCKITDENYIKNTCILENFENDKKPRKTIHFTENNDLEISSQNFHEETKNEIQNKLSQCKLEDSLKVCRNRMNTKSPLIQNSIKLSPNNDSKNLRSSLRLTENENHHHSIEKCRNAKTSLLINSTNLINLSGFQLILNDDDYDDNHVQNVIANDYTINKEKSYLNVNNDQKIPSPPPPPKTTTTTTTITKIDQDQEYKISNIFKKQQQEQQSKKSFCNYQLNNTSHIKISISPCLGNSPETEFLCNLDINNFVCVENNDDDDNDDKKLSQIENDNISGVDAIDDAVISVNSIGNSETTSTTTTTTNNNIDSLAFIHILDDINDENNSANDIEKTHISLIDTIDSIDESSCLLNKQKNLHIIATTSKCDESAKKHLNFKTIETTIAKTTPTAETIKCESIKKNPNTIKNQSLLCKKCKNCRRTLNDTTLTDFKIDKIDNKNYYELDFSGYEKFKNLPTMIDIIDEHNKRMQLIDDLSIKLKDRNSITEETIYGPEAPSFEFLLDNKRNELKKNVKYDFCLKSIFPLTQPFEYLLKNKFKSEIKHWRLDSFHFIAGLFEIYYKSIRTHKLVFKFPSKMFHPHNAIIFDDIKFIKNNDYKNWSPMDALYENEFFTKIPTYLKSFCESSDKVFELLDYLANIFENSVKLSNEFMKIVIRSDGILEKNPNGKLFVIKKTKKWINSFSVQEQNFMIRISHIDKISYSDIITPDLSEFNESIKLLPHGLDFIKEFLVEPQIFLK